MAADVQKNIRQLGGSQSDVSVKRQLLRKPRAPSKKLIPILITDKSGGATAGAPSLGSEDEDARFTIASPVLSGVPSVISPPPPSEMFSHPELRQQGHPALQDLPRHRYAAIRKGDLKFVLDPMYRGRTNVGTYVEGRSLVKPYRPRGPPNFPHRDPRKNAPLPLPPAMLAEQKAEEERYMEKPEFSLQDFLIELSEVHKIPLVTVKQIVLSKHNYKEIQNLLSERLKGEPQRAVHFKEFKPPADIPLVEKRIPQEQMLLEMVALIRQQMQEIQGGGGGAMKTSIRKMPKYSPDYKPGEERPHTEIVLYEDTSKSRRAERDRKKRATEQASKDSLFHTSNTKYFQGTKRADSPFDLLDEQTISPSELAVLDSIINGAKALSLKANFISTLPDLTNLTHTLEYLNLSFNDFRTVPMEVFSLHRLHTLKLRNNPLNELAPEVDNLTQLHTLTLSFCMLTHLPLGLFTLKRLKHLDIAYNKLSFIPNEVKQLSALTELNVEGNQLAGMPTGLLYLNRLKKLKVKNNYMHPLFWGENTHNAPQRLLDIAALACVHAGITHHTVGRVKIGYLEPDYVYTASDILQTHDTCDCCKRELFGPGLRIIRPVDRIFSISNLPFLFHSCSVSCRENFLSNSSTLTDMLYGGRGGRTPREAVPVHEQDKGVTGEQGEEEGVPGDAEVVPGNTVEVPGNAGKVPGDDKEEPTG